MNDNNNFEIDDQRPGEEIILVCHQHPWVLAKTGLVIILLILIFVVSLIIWGASLISVIVLIVAGIIIFLYGGTRYFLYKNAIFILTNHRVINISQKGIFKRKVQEINLENIFNLQYEISGPIKSFLNFGNLELTTVGNADDSIRVYNIENPHFVYEKVSHAKEKFKNSTKGQNIIR